MVKEMRRDNSNLWQGENVAFFFDTFHDKRNGVEFGVSPSGGRYEGQVTNERSYNGDWNPVWKVAVGRFAGGWTVEAALPFKSLRYGPGLAQVWGFQARRINAWKNELSFLTRLPPELGMGRGIFAASLAPAVVGLEAPERSKNLEVKPYTRADVTTNRTASPPVSNHVGGDVGLDVKYGPTENLSTDVTYNTDFAQVEADEQQLNLTRFSLFFPEKREFFLENQGTFAFGGIGSPDMPILFYSRRIGLSQGQAVPISAGGRLTGRMGPFTMGVLNIESSNQPLTGPLATNFSVVRLKRDILERSSIGLIATRRTAGDADSATNRRSALTGPCRYRATSRPTHIGRGRRMAAQRTMRRAIAGNSTMPAIGTASSSNGSSSERISIQELVTSGVLTCARTTATSASVLDLARASTFGSCIGTAR